MTQRNDSFPSLRESPKVEFDEDKLNQLRMRARLEVEQGLLPAVQFAVAQFGEIVWTETFGTATDSSLFSIFSCTKAITSAAAWLLIQDGVLDVEECVIDVIPEFNTNGKDSVRIIDLFLHTAGFPYAPFRTTDWSDHRLRMGRFQQWRLTWPVGSKFEYHPTSTMWVIAEIIERKAGCTFQEYVRSRVFKPLELSDLFLGLPPAEHHRVLPVEFVGESLTSEDYEQLGIPEPNTSELAEDVFLSLNSAEAQKVGVPGGGGIANASSLALFYQALLHGGLFEGERLWDQETLGLALSVKSGSHVDPVFGVRVNRALGVVVAGDEKRNYRGFGHTNSSRAFGHGGAGGQIAWADPETGLSFAYLTNGLDRNPIRLGRRGVSLSTKAASLIS